MEPGDLRGNSNTEGFSGSNLYLLKYIKIPLILVGQKYGKGGGVKYTLFTPNSGLPLNSKGDLNQSVECDLSGWYVWTLKGLYSKHSKLYTVE